MSAVIWTEESIRNELKRLDHLSGLHGTTLPISFTEDQHTLGSFLSCPMSFSFSNNWFQNPDWSRESALDTIRHEYAHYMDYVWYRGYGHGQTWKKCCAKVGAIPQRYYNANLEKCFQHIRQIAATAEKRASRYSVGQALLHPQYGKGIILSINPLLHSVA